MAISIHDLISRDGSVCAYCGGEMPPNGLTVDHVIPTTRGGPDTLDNTVLACWPCNIQKGDKNLLEYVHYLLVCKWMQEIAPDVIIPAAPPIVTIEGEYPTEFVPIAWYMGCKTLNPQDRPIWDDRGIVVRLQFDGDFSDIVLLSGPLYDYYAARNKRGRPSE